MIKQLTFIIICVWSFTACDSLIVEVDPKKIPKNVELLVINAYISPQDTLLIANVQKTKMVFSETFNVNNSYENSVKDAKVVLSDGAKQIILNYNPVEFVYTASTKNFKIEPNKTYKLTVTDNKGKLYTAETKVPTPVDFKVGKLVKSTKSNFDQQNYTVPITLLTDKDTYYRGGVFYTQTQEFFQNGSFQKINIEQGGFTLELFKSTGQNKQSLSKNLTAYFFNNNSSAFLSKPKVKLYHVDKNYYLFHESIKGNNNDNPFAEPKLVFSNIKNGYGCFGSYVLTEMPFLFP